MDGRRILELEKSVSAAASDVRAQAADVLRHTDEKISELKEEVTQSDMDA